MSSGFAFIKDKIDCRHYYNWQHIWLLLWHCSSFKRSKKEISTFGNENQGVPKIQEKVYSCRLCPYVTNKVGGIGAHMSSKIHNPNRKPRENKGKEKKSKKNSIGPKAQPKAILLEADDEATVEVKEVPKILRNLKRRPVCCTEPGCQYITNKKSNLKAHKLRKHL